MNNTYVLTFLAALSYFYAQPQPANTLRHEQQKQFTLMHVYEAARSEPKHVSCAEHVRDRDALFDHLFDSLQHPVPDSVSEDAWRAKFMFILQTTEGVVCLVDPAMQSSMHDIVSKLPFGLSEIVRTATTAPEFRITDSAIMYYILR